MKRSQNNILAALVFFIAIMAMALGSTLGCQPEPEGHIYRIGLGQWIGFGPFYLAQEKGFFKELGIRVDLIVLTGLAERNTALKSGRIDALAAPVDYFVQAAGNRLAATIVMAVDESIGGDGIVANSSIHRFEDLRGRRVAFQRGFPSEFFLRVLLHDHKIRLEDLQPVDMETGQAGAAFVTKKLDAAVLWEPWLTKAVEKGNGHILASTLNYRDLIVDCLAFNNDVVSRFPQDVQGIVNALLKAIEYWQKRPAEANRVMAPHFRIDEHRYEELLRGLIFCDLRCNRHFFSIDGTEGSLYDVAKRASDIWREARVIAAPVIAKSIISTDFVRDAEVRDE